MATAQTSMPRGEAFEGGDFVRGKGVFLSSSDFAALMDELESLRAAIRTEGRRQSQDETPNAPVAAPALDDVATRGAGLGSVVRVADRAGRTTEYELTERSDPAPARQQVILSSPNGTALLGARPGDYARVTLANGRQRRVRIVSVTPTDLLRAPVDARAAVGELRA